MRRRGFLHALHQRFCLPDALVTETGARLPEIGSNGGRRRRGTVASRLHTEPFTPINSPTKRAHHADE